MLGLWMMVYLMTTILLFAWLLSVVSNNWVIGIPLIIPIFAIKLYILENIYKEIKEGAGRGN